MTIKATRPGSANEHPNTGHTNPHKLDFDNTAMNFDAGPVPPTSAPEPPLTNDEAKRLGAMGYSRNR